MKKMNIMVILALGCALLSSGNLEAGFRDSVRNAASKVKAKIKSAFGYTRSAVKRALASKTVKQLQEQAVALVKDQAKKGLDAASAYALTQTTGLLEKAGNKAVASVNNQLTKAGLPPLERAAREAVPVAAQLENDIAGQEYGDELESLFD